MADDFHLLLINGSLRGASTNGAALRTAADEGGVGVRFTTSTAMGVLPHYNPDLDAAPLPSAVEALRAEVHRADAVLFSVPEYAGALPGSLKNLLDWTVGDDQPGSIYRKPVGWINASTRGAVNAHQSLRTVLGYVGATVVDAACIDVPITGAMIGADGLVDDPAVRERLRDAVRALRSGAAAPTP